MGSHSAQIAPESDHCPPLSWGPKDVLIEALWPEVSPVSGERNFKVILHRLRKTLEPEMSKDFGSSYIHLKANLVSLDEELCRIDLDDFLSLCRRGSQKQEEGDIKSAIALFKQALDLYSGDFLAEDLYAPWAEARRNDLRERYLNLLFRTAELLEKQGTSKAPATIIGKSSKWIPPWSPLTSG